MSEQIKTLIEESRKQIDPFLARRLEQRLPRRPGQKIARTVAFTSGKGGVGKTNLVANTALALAQAGKRVIILDGDLGLANIDVVFGIRPQASLVDVLAGRKALEEVLIDGPAGLQLIAGGSGVKELAQLSGEGAARFFSQMAFLEDRADFVLVDTGAGIAETVVGFCLAADEVVVVTNPEPTAMADAYGIIKVIALSRPEARVGVLVNRVADPAEAEWITQRLQRVAHEFLAFPVTAAGHVVQDRNLLQAVRAQTPLLLFAPTSPAARDIRAFAARQFLGLDAIADPTTADPQTTSAGDEPGAGHDAPIGTVDETTPAEAPGSSGFFARLARHLVALGLRKAG